MNDLFCILMKVHKSNPYSRIVSGILMILIGGGILAVTLASYISDRIKCKVPVKAVILRFDEETRTSKKSKEPVKVYTPIYGYTYNNRKFESRTSSYFAKPAHEIGETVQIRINPAEPTQLIDRIAPDIGMIIIWVAMAITAGLGIVALFGN